MKRKAKYKPLLFTTTMRNPERLKSFLSILKKYNGCILNNKLAKKIAREIILQLIKKNLTRDNVRKKLQLS